MKYLLAACAAAFALSASAFAEVAAPAQPAAPPLPPATASQCTTALPADPTFPDGATANSRAMDAGNTAYQAWAEGFRAVYECNRTEYQQALANLRARQATMEGLNAKVSSLTAAWEAEVTEFNARPPRDRR